MNSSLNALRPTSHKSNTNTIRRKLLSIAIAQAILGFSVAHAANIDVNSSADGTDPTDCTLRDALISANTDQAAGGCIAGSGVDTVTFNGLTTPATINLTEGVLTISAPMTLQGPGRDQLTLDAGGLSQVLKLNNGDFNSNIDVAVDGLTFTNGSHPFYNGAGVSVAHENLILSNSTISSNVGNEGGGGLYVGQRSTVVITSSDITGNTARFGGGGIDSRGSLKLYDSNVSNNFLVSGSGAGIASFDGYLSLVHSTISGNTAEGSNRDGGGLNCRRGTEIHITDSQITSNVAPQGGALAIGYRCNVSISNSTLAANTATGTGSTDRGGAISANSNGKAGDERFTISMANSTLSGNSANRIGAIYASGGVLSLDHVTVTDNSAVQGTYPVPPYGNLFGPVGGIQVDSNFQVSNSIIANNTGADCNDIFDPLVTNLNNLISDGSCSTGAVGLIAGDPLIGPLQDNAGFTPTHALLTGSPALNAGDAGACAERDQRGVKRSGGGCDVGAVEATQFVDTLADNMTVDGLCSLREAFEATNFKTLVDTCVAGNGDDTILFDPVILPGTITLQGTKLRTYSSLEIQGPGAEQLTISGNSLSTVLDFNDSSGVLQNVAISGLTLTGGSTTFDGGAVSNNEDLTIHACVITGNQAGRGAGVFTSLGTLTMTNSVVTGNTATSRGAGFFSQEAVATITDSQFDNNQASVGGAGGYAFTGTVTIMNSSFSNNVGGGFVASGTQTTITDSTFSGNNFGSGGGISQLSSNYGSSVMTIQNSTIAGNIAEYYGGGIFSDGDLTLFNSTISGNSATRGGGGIVTNNGVVLLANSTISGNILDETSLRRGAGLWLRSASSTVHMANTIIANGVGANECVSFGGQFAFHSNNLIEDGTCSDGAVNFLSGDPLLGPLQDNGGPTFTHLPLAGGPAQNAGDKQGLPYDFDQRGAGFPRVLGGEVDLGSVEVDWKFGALAIDPASIMVNETTGMVDITVTRSGGSDGEVAATVNTLAGTATAGLDFTAIVDGTVIFADGDIANKTISVILEDDNEAEIEEMFTVQISNPSNGATLGNDTASVTINDDDKANQEVIFVDGFETPE